MQRNHLKHTGKIPLGNFFIILCEYFYMANAKKNLIYFLTNHNVYVLKPDIL